VTLEKTGTKDVNRVFRVHGSNGDFDRLWCCSDYFRSSLRKPDTVFNGVHRLSVPFACKCVLTTDCTLFFPENLDKSENYKMVGEKSERKCGVMGKSDGICLFRENVYFHNSN